MRNRVSLDATLVKKQALRYTPVGVPVIEVGLKHTSIQQDGKRPRAVELEMDAVGIGDVAQRIDGVPLGAEVQLEGFLAPKGKLSAVLVLHINELVNRSTEVKD